MLKQAVVSAICVLVVAGHAQARPTTHTITTVGTSWSPMMVNAQSGDTIQWTNLFGGFHTVVQTTGTGTCSTLASPLFGSPPGATTYSWVIPSDFTGQVFFKCNPHCSSGMRGTIIIMAPPPPPDPCPGDADGDRIVNFADITSVLTHFGGTGPSGDADHDADVDFGDVTAVLTFFTVPCP